MPFHEKKEATVLPVIIFWPERNGPLVARRASSSKTQLTLELWVDHDLPADVGVRGREPPPDEELSLSLQVDVSQSLLFMLAHQRGVLTHHVLPDVGREVLQGTHGHRTTVAGHLREQREQYSKDIKGFDKTW